MSTIPSGQRMAPYPREVGVLWGKSDAGGSVHLLLGHLLDTAAVAELIWDRYLAPTVRRRIDACCAGRGRSLLALICGWHDVGKASPAFQSKAGPLADRVQAAGLGWRPLTGAEQKWHHTYAGAMALRRTLKASGWDRAAIDWVWPLIAGHHGTVPGWETIQPPGPGRGNAQGQGLWEQAQDALIYLVADALGVDLPSLVPRPPNRADQLTILGLVVMADWIASASTAERFPGIDEVERISMASARRRAEDAWERLELSGGWRPEDLTTSRDPIRQRFDRDARPAQKDAVALAERAPAPGLFILEAPMGEGKTEAALAVAEVLARRFGQDGVFVGMPTQATSDPMFTRVLAWMQRIDGEAPVALLHGKREFNSTWKALRRQVRFSGVDEDGDEFGIRDDYGCPGASTCSTSRGGERNALPAEWFLGRKRGLLTPSAVGTIDQLLHAATRTRHVMLRHAGLAGRVVILDEVHAYDVYMAQFLREALRWLADAGVPVVLLSATLPPAMRADLARAYLQGAQQRWDVEVPLPEVDGYPNALAVCPGQSSTGAHVEPVASLPWRASLPVEVTCVPEAPADGPEAVAALLRETLHEGGCALVVRNTVSRAQQTYLALKETFGDDVVLLHARFTVGERAARTESVLARLGDPSRDGAVARPQRLVVVATQLAEQSFDIDADLLVTDLAPMDLLLQRAGRLHRHDRPREARPVSVRSPRVVVTGMSRTTHGPPAFPGGSVAVYGRYPLLRAAALVGEALDEGRGWSIPVEVPTLVARAYSGDDTWLPEPWAEAVAAAREKAEQDRDDREGNARSFLLSGRDHLGEATLAGLHDSPTGDLDDDDQVAAVVRDGDPSVEVILVCRDPAGGYRTLGGRTLGVNGEAVTDDAVLEEVLACGVRLPSGQDLTRLALDELRPLPGWSSDPWLRRARALALDEGLSAQLGRHRLTYDVHLGLQHRREGAR